MLCIVDTIYENWKTFKKITPKNSDNSASSVVYLMFF